MKITREQFKTILSLREVAWEQVSPEQRQIALAKAREGLAKLPEITLIEGVRPEKQENARWLYKTALTRVVDTLGAEEDVPAEPSSAVAAFTG